MSRYVLSSGPDIKYSADILMYSYQLKIKHGIIISNLTSPNTIFIYKSIQQQEVIEIRLYVKLPLAATAFLVH